MGRIRRDGICFVYFLKNRETGRIKIGASDAPGSRAYHYQQASDCELELLGYIPGNEDDERAWHRRFQAHRVRGEWFEGVPEVLDAVGRAVTRAEALWAEHGVRGRPNREQFAQIAEAWASVEAGARDEPPCLCPHCRRCKRKRGGP